MYESHNPLNLFDRASADRWQLASRFGRRTLEHGIYILVECRCVHSPFSPWTLHFIGLKIDTKSPYKIIYKPVNVFITLPNRLFVCVAANMLHSGLRLICNLLIRYSQCYVN